MEKEKVKKERIKRTYAEKGQRSQKMFNFRLDLENLDWLNQQQNKGRYINELISKDRLGK